MVSFQSNLRVHSIRLCCPDCRKERRREARERCPPLEGWQQEWRWWKEWTSGEDDGERKRIEAERLKEVELRWSSVVDGW
jgi:hypothetical protein